LKTSFLERNEYSFVPSQHSRADAADKFRNNIFSDFFHPKPEVLTPPLMLISLKAISKP